MCNFEGCDCQTPPACINKLCSEHCTGCDVHKAGLYKHISKTDSNKVKKKSSAEPKPVSQKISNKPVIIKDITCMAYKECVHVF